MGNRFLTVPDTNIIISALKNPNKKSPNKEYIDLWIDERAFKIL